MRGRWDLGMNGGSMVFVDRKEEGFMDDGILNACSCTSVA